MARKKVWFTIATS